jgi:hypothetical protein
LAVFATAVDTALVSRRSSTDETTRSLAQSLVAMVAAGTVSFATFDAFGFPQASTLVFLGIGCIAALANTVSLDPNDDGLLPRPALVKSGPVRAVQRDRAPAAMNALIVRRTFRPTHSA